MKKAILVVSFGTSYKEARILSIENIENNIKDTFKEYDVFRAFTSHMIIRKIERVEGIKIHTPEEKLEILLKEGYEEVIMQPLHIIPGEEYDYIKNVANNYKDRFKSIKVGRPIFYYLGDGEEAPNDYEIFIDSMKDVLNLEENIVLFGHGTFHIASAVYGCLQSLLEDKGYNNVFVGTVEGYPSLENVISRLNKREIKEITLVPLMLVCGDHVRNDMASLNEDSWKSILEKNGFKVNVILKGLGEYENIKNLYVNRVRDTIEDKYEGIGKTKKGHKKVK